MYYSKWSRSFSGFNWRIGFGTVGEKKRRVLGGGGGESGFPGGEIVH